MSNLYGVAYVTIQLIQFGLLYFVSLLFYWDCLDGVAGHVSSNLSRQIQSSTAESVGNSHYNVWLGMLGVQTKTPATGGGVLKETEQTSPVK